MKYVLCFCILLLLFLFSSNSSVLASTYTVTNTSNTGAGSLRQAMTDANSSCSGSDTIIFNIPNSDGGYNASRGVWTITVSSQLPNITCDGLTINGQTQAQNFGTETNDGDGDGFMGTGGTVGVDEVSLAKVNAPEIEVTENNNVGYGINISQDTHNITIKGLAIYGFNTNDLRVSTGTSSTNLLFEQNIFGAKADSFTKPSSNQTGGRIINLSASTGTLRNNLIGFPKSGSVTVMIEYWSQYIVEFNELKSDGSGDGIYVQQSATQNIVRNNLISNYTSGNGYCMVINTSSGANNIYQNNSMYNCAFGIASWVTSGAAQTITKNIVHDCSSYGIVLVYGGNTVTYNHVYNNSSYGIASQVATTNSNIISFNTVNNNAGEGIAVIWYDDVAVTKPSGQLISQNSIYDNGNLGIDLLTNDSGTGRGINVNDNGDTDAGTNEFQNYPAINNALLNGSTITLTADLDFNSNEGPFTIELFSNDENDSSGNGEGKYFIGSTSVSTIGSNISIPISITGTTPIHGQYITATATNNLNSTSEFSASYQIDTQGGSFYDIEVTVSEYTSLINYKTTDELSTQMYYGETTSYGFSTTIVDISPRVISHSISIFDLKKCHTYYYYLTGTDAAGNGATGNGQTFTTSGCSSSSSTSSTPQIPFSSQTNGGGGVVSAVVESGSAFSGTSQQITAIIEPHTLSFDSYLSSSATIPIILPTLGTILPNPMTGETPTTKPKQQNTVSAGGVLGITSSSGISWQIGTIQNIWYKAYAPGTQTDNAAKIIPELQHKPSIIALSYTPADLIPPGNPTKPFTPQSLKLAHSIDGITWKILSTSVVDPINHTVAALDKVGGYYMIVAVPSGRRRTTSIPQVRGVTTNTKQQIPSKQPHIVPQKVKGETTIPQHTPPSLLQKIGGFIHNIFR